MKTAELAYWINSRENMRVRKERGDRNYVYGYSDDPHMGTVRYCNVHREDDKVTRWLAEHWRPKHHAVWEIVLARMINYIPTLECLTLALPYPSEVVLERVATCLKNVRESGQKVFTSAYTISTCGQRMDKIDYVMGVVAQCREIDINPGKAWIWEKSYHNDLSLRSAHRDLTEMKGLGSFLAAQVVADLKNTRGHPLETAPDRATWAAPGPGSLRGLQAFYGRPATARTFAQDIAQCYAATMPLVEEHVKPIDMQDFQNCLCEFSKYMKIKEGRGHARNNYRAG